MQIDERGHNPVITNSGMPRAPRRSWIAESDLVETKGIEETRGALLRPFSERDSFTGLRVRLPQLH